LAIETRFSHYSQADAAVLLGCSRAYVSKLVAKGRLPFVQRGGRKWLTAEGLQAYLGLRLQRSLPMADAKK
jgi:excisionase family DNA binding protein